MKIQTRPFLKAATAIALVLTFGLSANAQQIQQPKIRVGVAPAEDRWITLTDGSRVYEGLEVSYLLGQSLFDSQKYIPVLLSQDSSLQAPLSNLVTSLAVQKKSNTSNPNQVLDNSRMGQIPQEWMQWTAEAEVQGARSGPAHVMSANANANADASFPVYVDMTVTPIIETLIYASGNKSDRLVFGFSPDHLNPFNQGRAGTLDNSYIASPTQQESCVKPDFFSGQLNPAGWGPFVGNFGSNLDEGFSFNILGFGFGFKKKQFNVVSQIRFLLDNHINGQHDELVFQTKASGEDVFVDGSYSGFELGVEIQRRQTLLDALKKILPQIIDNLLTHGMGGAWESSIISLAPAPTLAAGADEGVVNGLQVQSPFGATYQVTQVGATTSALTKIGGLTSPFVGEPLRVYTGQPIQWVSSSSSSAAAQLVSVRSLTAASTNAPPVVSQEKIFQTSMTIPFDQTQADKIQRAAVQVNQTQACFGKGTSWIVQTIDFFFELYAWWKYDNVYDQAPHNDLPVVATAGVPKVAVIDSGIDYNDGDISSHFIGTAPRQVLGYDFISWDTRPSDDNGHGTAAAKLLAQSTKKNFVLVPVKVIGTRGETHSSAIYDGFDYAINNHVDAILVPWASQESTLAAYQMGAQKAAQAGIPVFVAPNSISAGTNIYVPTSVPKKGFKTGGLGGASVQLDPGGVAAVQLLVQWLQSQSLGGSNVK